MHSYRIVKITGARRAGVQLCTEVRARVRRDYLYSWALITFPPKAPPWTPSRAKLGLFSFRGCPRSDDHVFGRRL